MRMREGQTRRAGNENENGQRGGGGRGAYGVYAEAVRRTGMNEMEEIAALLAERREQYIINNRIRNRDDENVNHHHQNLNWMRIPDERAQEPATAEPIMGYMQIQCIHTDTHPLQGDDDDDDDEARRIASLCDAVSCMRDNGDAPNTTRIRLRANRGVLIEFESANDARAFRATAPYINLIMTTLARNPMRRDLYSRERRQHHHEDEDEELQRQRDGRDRMHAAERAADIDVRILEAPAIDTVESTQSYMLVMATARASELLPNLVEGIREMEPSCDILYREESLDHLEDEDARGDCMLIALENYAAAIRVQQYVQGSALHDGLNVVIVRSTR